MSSTRSGPKDYERPVQLGAAARTRCVGQQAMRRRTWSRSGVAGLEPGQIGGAGALGGLFDLELDLRPLF